MSRARNISSLLGADGILNATDINALIGYTPIAPTNNVQTTGGTSGAIHIIKEIEQFQFGGSGISDEYLLLCPHTTSTYSDPYQIMGEIFASRGGQASGNSFDVTQVNVGRAYSQLFGSIQTKDGSSTSSFVHLVTCTYGGVRWLAARARNGGGPAHNGIYFRGWIVGSDANMLKRVRAADISNVTLWKSSGYAPNIQTGYADNISDEFVINIDASYPVSVVYFSGWHSGALNLYLQLRDSGGTNLGNVENNIYTLARNNTYWSDYAGTTWCKLNPGSFDVDGNDWGGVMVVRQPYSSRASVLVDMNFTKSNVGSCRTTGSLQVPGSTNTAINKIAVNGDASGSTPTISGRWMTVGYNNSAMV